MHHVPDGVLRRLVDEPLAVPDDDAGHVQHCRRCQAHHDQVRRDAHAVRGLLGRPQAVPDLDRAWERLNRAPLAPTRHVPKRIRPRPLAGAAGVATVAGVLAAGAAAAATLTIVYSPTHVAPLPVSTTDLHSLTSALGLGQSGLWDTHSVPQSGSGSQPPSSTANSTAASTSGATPATPGTRSWAYGTIQWATGPKPVKTTSLATAESAAGTTLALPGTLPAGVEGSPTYLALRRSTATVSFDAAAGPSLAGSTLTVDAGPGILAEYGGTLGASSAGGSTGHIPTLAVAAMQRPTATSTGATTTQLESFVLGRPGFPPALAQEIRLLGDLRTALPVPVPSGVTQTSTTIAGSPAVLLSADGGTASVVVWEDQGGTIHTVGGLLDRQDVLDVARQLG